MRNPSHDTQTGKSPVSAIDLTAWFEQHDALVYHLVHMCAKVLAKAKVELDDEATALVANAYDSVRAHAKKLVGDGVPVVLAKDGKHTINYDQFAEARAKVRVLTLELNELRAEKCISNRYTNDVPPTVCISDRYTEGRQAMHAEVVDLFERPIAQLAAAAAGHPALAEKLSNVAHPLRVMLEKVRALPVELPTTLPQPTPCTTAPTGTPA